ncbi:MAG: hypothetical protein NkDv07_0321 [Candidatus Improbicoccus devescovinae]|nr:MAG: hypothetical protein NkDv07_0321 [Candidatus Improbicoccus devescovinae]
MKNTEINKIYQGYEHLAFGKITDAVKLMWTVEPNFVEIEQMDLFCVSEIERPRDNSLKIKFFDRLRALEKLENLVRESAKDQNDLLENFYLSLENSK